jgi:hypothetical protein
VLAPAEKTSVSKQDDIFRASDILRASDIIRASEVGQHAYCARAWWLARKLGYRSWNVDELRRGTANHQAHGRSVLRYLRMRQLALAFLLLAVVALVVWIVTSVRV